MAHRSKVGVTVSTGAGGPRSGKLAKKKVTPKRGKPKMSAAAWAKLSNREKKLTTMAQGLAKLILQSLEKVLVLIPVM